MEKTDATKESNSDAAKVGNPKASGKGDSSTNTNNSNNNNSVKETKDGKNQSSANKSDPADKKQTNSGNKSNQGGKKSPASKNAANEDIAKPPGLLALLVAFPLPEHQSVFAPVYGDDSSPALLPINGIPLLTYALDFLTQNAVTEICILVKQGENGERIQALVADHSLQQQRKQSNKSSQFKSYCTFVPNSIVSVGDALRDVHSRTNITDTFIVLTPMSFLVGDIRDSITLHNNRMANPRDSCTTGSPLMTVVYSAQSPSSGQRGLADDSAIIFDESNMELHAVVPMTHARHLHCDQELLSRIPPEGALQIRYDLCDPGIYICSPAVLDLFSQSFDYMDIRKDFIPSILTTDLRLASLHCYIIEVGKSGIQNRYAANLGDPRRYFVTLRNVLERWTHPIVPDSHAVSGQTYLRYRGRGVYQASSVVTGLRCEVGPLVSLSDSVHIGNDGQLGQCFIGKDCVLGEKCRLEGSILLDNVLVGDNVEMQHAFIGNKVEIGNNAKIGKGVVIGPHCKISENTEIPPYTRIFNPKYTQYITVDNLQPLNKDSVGFVLPQSFYTTSTQNNQVCSLGSSILHAIRLPLPKFDGFSESNKDGSDSDSDSECWGSPRQFGRQDTNSKTNKEDADKEFYSEITAMTREGLENPSVMQNKILEMKSFRLASNKTDLEVMECIIVEVLKQIVCACGTSKEKWSKYSATNRLPYLCESFTGNAEVDEGELDPVWDAIASFCCEESIEINQWDDSDSECEETPQENAAEIVKKIENPYYGSSGFCRICEHIHSIDILETDISLPIWKSRLASREGKLPDDVFNRYKDFCENNRLVAFIQWLEVNDSDA